MQSCQAINKVDILVSWNPTCACPSALLCLKSNVVLLRSACLVSYPTSPVLKTSSPATEESCPKENPFILVPSSKTRWAVWAWEYKEGRQMQSQISPKNNTFSFYEACLDRPKAKLWKGCVVDFEFRSVGHQWASGSSCWTCRPVWIVLWMLRPTNLFFCSRCVCVCVCIGVCVWVKHANIKVGNPVRPPASGHH